MAGACSRSVLIQKSDARNPEARRGVAPAILLSLLFWFLVSVFCFLVSERQTACKPGSVLPSQAGMAIPLGRRLPDASRGLPGRRLGNEAWGPSLATFAAPIWPCSRWGLPCRPRRRGRGALLPPRFTLAGYRDLSREPAVSSLWHCPWGRPRRVLPGTVLPWSPDFPPPVSAKEAEGSHPAVWQRLR
jgi:hypothetical protein